MDGRRGRTGEWERKTYKTGMRMQTERRRKRWKEGKTSKVHAKAGEEKTRR